MKADPRPELSMATSCDDIATGSLSMLDEIFAGTDFIELGISGLSGTIQVSMGSTSPEGSALKPSPSSLPVAPGVPLPNRVPRLLLLK